MNRKLKRDSLVASGDVNGLASMLFAASRVASEELRGPKLLARITAHGTGAAYGWNQVIDNADGTYSDQPAIIGETSWGTATAAPAYELGGRTDVPIDGSAIVELFPGQQDQAAFYFRYDGASANGGTTGCPRFINNITASRCLTLALFDVLGRCGCIPSHADIPLIYSASDSAHKGQGSTLVYGCPPGISSITIGDAPRKFRIVATGFTGACSVLNGTWTFTYVPGTGGTYTATLNGISATLVLNPGSPSGVVPELTFFDVGGHNITFESDAIASACSDFTLGSDDVDLCDGSPDSLAVVRVTACGLGVGYKPYLKTCTDCSGNVLPYLLLVPQGGGSGVRSIKVPLVECGVDGSGRSYGEFATSDALLCTGSEDGECTENSVRWRVYCAACPNPGYAGPGWYCTGTACQEFTSDPGLGVTLIDGPYETEEECSCTVAVACLATPVRKRLCLQFGTSTPDANFTVDGKRVSLVYTGGNWVATINAGTVYETTFTLTPCVSGVETPDVLKYYWRLTSTLIDDPGTYIEMGLIADAPLDATLPITGTISWGSGMTGVDSPFTVTDGDCPEESYNLVDPETCECRDPKDGTGTHKGANALEKCQAACLGAGGDGGGGSPGTGCCGITAGSTATITIVGGPKAGVYVASWYVNVGRLFAEFPGLDWLLSCGAGGVDGFAISDFSGTFPGFHEASGVICSPFSATFNPALGGTGTTSVTLT